MVLDLTRVEVRDYLFDAISNVLSNAKIEYVKWDMNRPLTEVFSQRNNDEDSSRTICNLSTNDFGVWQSETSYRYTLGVYELQQRIVSAFPNVLLENSASGGGNYS
jgi:alpha-galactosidase